MGRPDGIPVPGLVPLRTVLLQRDAGCHGRQPAPADVPWVDGLHLQQCRGQAVGPADHGYCEAPWPPGLQTLDAHHECRSQDGGRQCLGLRQVHCQLRLHNPEQHPAAYSPLRWVEPGCPSARQHRCFPGRRSTRCAAPGGGRGQAPPAEQSFGAADDPRALGHVLHHPKCQHPVPGTGDVRVKPVGDALDRPHVVLQHSSV
mmetsp:Transcript_114472/g.199113  ORF Transcript_114472/g.199113 Transcript_114472/m.199113 type:complete len:202 (-) Transcript_114472:1000-1605(-)